MARRKRGGQTRSIGVASRRCKGKKGRARSKCMKRIMKGPKRKK